MLGATALGFAAPALADPPSRVARLAYSSGAVSFSPAGDDDWVAASVNRPLIDGDRLWADPGARDELQIGGAAIRMSGDTLLTLLNVDDRLTQLQLSQGRLNFKVRRLNPDEVLEIDTPNLAFSIRQPGEYRIDVDPQGNATTVAVHSGQGEAYGEGNAYLIDRQQSYRFGGTDLRDSQFAELAPADEFDHWTAERDRRIDNSQAGRYVSHDMVGYEDLDQNGTWREVQGYGNVWTPSHVSADWAPYHDGHWSWVEPWGWTWVDDAPWGFAVSHYGRWANMQGSWAWVPGPAAARPVYAPALVVFVGGGNLRLSQGGGGGGMAWFPLAPREVYRPSYHVSQNYITNINTSNTTLNQTQITNVYNNVTNITYVNRQVKGAVVAVPTAAFVHAQPVRKAAVVVPVNVLASAPVAQLAAVAPQHASLGGNGMAGHRPAAAVLARQVIVKTAPPPPPPPFAQRQTALAANAGRPLEPAAVAGLQAAAPKPAAPQFKVLHPAPAGAPLGKPPAHPPATLAQHPLAPVPAAAPSSVPGALPAPGAPGGTHPAVPAPVSPAQAAQHAANAAHLAAGAPLPGAATPLDAKAPQHPQAKPEEQRHERDSAFNAAGKAGEAPHDHNAAPGTDGKPGVPAHEIDPAQHLAGKPDGAQQERERAAAERRASTGIAMPDAHPAPVAPQHAEPKPERAPERPPVAHPPIQQPEMAPHPAPPKPEHHGAEAAHTAAAKPVEAKPAEPKPAPQHPPAAAKAHEHEEGAQHKDQRKDGHGEEAKHE
ncbi:MAG TPA: hypothetical protein DCW29_01445 [Janthinobacterium sp.]|nr:hypothetical protein [Janthinobacterium sp.]